MTKVCMMIDLETLDTKTTAVVVSGGYVIFDRERPEYLEHSSSFSKFHFQDQITLGRTISESTIRWHIEHPTDTFIGKADTSIYTWLMGLSDHIIAGHVEEVWSKGANFDISIIETFGKYWGYKLPRCFRTIQALFPDCYEENPLAHNALEDARNQAKELWRITQKYLLHVRV